MDALKRMHQYHSKLDTERINIAKNTQPETLTIGMDRKLGFKTLINHYKCNIGIEIGVRAAEFSEYLVYNTRLYFTHGVDIVDCEDGRKLEARFPSNYKFWKADSLKAANFWPDDWFDFIYIDGSHKYHHVKRELPLWWSKLKPGGILGFDDMLGGYFCQSEGLFGNTDAMFEFAEQSKLQIYLIGSSELNHKRIAQMADYCGQQNERRCNNLPNTFTEPLQAFLIKK